MSMSKQEIFTRVAVHLLRQMSPSMDGHGCVYRGPDGLKCAVGALIPDELCTPEFLVQHNGSSVASYHVREVLVEAGVLSDNSMLSDGLHMLGHLQTIHDGADPHEWAEKLKHFAKSYKLLMPRLNDIDALNESSPAKITTTIATKEGATHE